MRRSWGIAGAVLSCALLTSAPAGGYPLDGYGYTGIERLEGYRLAQRGEVSGANKVPKGARLPLAQVDLRLVGHPYFHIPPPDPEFTARVVALLGKEAPDYGIAVLDLSDLAHPRYAEYNADVARNPGSVGKLMVAMGLFQALADIYPHDIEARLRVLRTTEVEADDFIVHDHHTVPFWHPGDRRVVSRPLHIGDRGTLYEFLDWMLSASSNAAASTVIEQLLLLAHYGRAYPVPRAEIDRFFADTPKRELGALLRRALIEPVARNGLDPGRLRQGSLFTARGKARVPGTTSYATPRELLRALVKLEQGRIVDRFSSREIKRLLYMTQRRIRYASSPALNDAAVYFKSGSLYQCKPEPGFRCLKYHGNVKNYMNSIAIVESPAGAPRLYYMVALMSNVLRKNSAVVHQTLATRLQRLISEYHRPAPRAAARSDKRDDRTSR